MPLTSPSSVVQAARPLPPRGAAGGAALALRAGVLAGAPLAFAALLLLHPNGGEPTYHALIASDPGAWVTVHLGAAALFPVMAWVVWRLLDGVSGRAATVARVALPVFAVAYGVYEALVGIAAGLVVREAGAGDASARRAVEAITTDPFVGELGVFNSAGAVAWLVAVAAAILALKGPGVPTAARALLGAGALMVMHVPPIGPVALVCLSGAALLVERSRGRSTVLPA